MQHDEDITVTRCKYHCNMMQISL